MLGFKDIGAHSLRETTCDPSLFLHKCLPLKVDPVTDSLVSDKIALGTPPICDFLPPPPGKPHVRSQLLPVLRPLARSWAGHAAGALRVGTLFLPPLSFGRPTCLFHGRPSWLLQEALCGERGRHLRKSAIGKDRSQGHRRGQEQAGASGSTARPGLTHGPADLCRLVWPTGVAMALLLPPWSNLARSRGLKTIHVLVTQEFLSPARPLSEL